ncbi:anaphase-promoting complex subunit 1 [Microdochium nivale]|nr:anaphase-promoting complex subunit 1 [Microdochium nivale]
MASVTSLGIHQPTALAYAVAEQLLPENPSPADYTWDIVVDHVAGLEDELLVTRDTVVWSRGCVFRKSFGFKLEKEPITQALLANFPDNESSDGQQRLARALVVFLSTQAHIYFLDGTSHVVHMPFEVESACAAPLGIIVQRKHRIDSAIAASLKFPRVPPSSFITNPLSPNSVRSSQPIAFSTESLGRPKALPVRLQQDLQDIWDSPPEKVDSLWPRLVVLSDPLLELGLVVTQQDKTATAKQSRRTSGRSPNFLDSAEEILHIEEIPEPGSSSQTASAHIVLAITANRETSTYTVWRYTRLRSSDPFTGTGKTSRRKSDRRRSSMQPGLPSGASTPVPATYKDTFLQAPLPGKRSRKSENIEKTGQALETLESSLGLEKEGVTRRTSRRVSSMLARADLSASHDRAGFVDQPQVSNPAARRDTSHGSQRNRTSAVSFNTSASYAPNTLAGFLDAPVDSLLDELRSGGDFEGFHSMGLDDHDFEGLSQEVLFAKIHSFPIDNSNVRYSLSKQPAKTQCKVFLLASPGSLMDERGRWQVLVGIQDPMEKRLQLLSLHMQSASAPQAPHDDSNGTTISFGQLRKAQNVIDSCKIVDGDTSTILVLSEGEGGRRELSLQAPWSRLTSISLPRKLALANLRGLDYGGSLVTHEVGTRRAITPIIGEMGRVCYPRLKGRFDVLDVNTQQLHQIQIQLRPSSMQVDKLLTTLSHATRSAMGDNMLAAWWEILAWMKTQDDEPKNVEWSAFVVLIFVLYLAPGFHTASQTAGTKSPRRRSRGFLRSSSGAQVDLNDWYTMNTIETPNISLQPVWANTAAWQWTVDEDTEPQTMFRPPAISKTNLSFPAEELQLALRFIDTKQGIAACGPEGYLPTSRGSDEAGQQRVAHDAFMALHLHLEEQKISPARAQVTTHAVNGLKAVLLVLAGWMGWDHWVQSYALELPLEWAGHKQDIKVLATAVRPAAPVYWNAFEWITMNFVQHSGARYMLPAVASRLPQAVIQHLSLFEKLFSILQTGQISPTQLVEALDQAGFKPTTLESLPDPVLVPLQDALARCRINPPPEWSRKLLQLVGRGDIGSAFSASSTADYQSTNIRLPNHDAAWDFTSLCQNVMELNDSPLDDMAEAEKQAVIRLLFKDDRRLEETRKMLNTSKPRIIRLDPLPEWTETVYLEQQKEVVTRLATNTLSIPAGRGLMNYGLRFPLLTQKFHIHGFVLNSTVKPTDTTVGVDKSLFTEDKIAWAFFHSGVAGGLAISRAAKGIDTSWILYNKPGNDLNNRHAGFLLALGLNGHLKGMAKWVAFKYLTPKHTMTSIGLLLGLAASYMGTMDSLITRLLSVHVTRMLPRGAAELNLSPLTQTTGIMGIGLLYCDSQHRRMSEIMMSEIEHVETDDDEEPLRGESYRLAAGFALGFINLGCGSDLKGLHDMRITEKLLGLASSSKKIEHVHVLDRSIAAAVIAVALMYMKTEDHIVARKVDIPDATLQFDYIRPDILLLRTVAKHLILWSKIEPSHEWICTSLPQRYQARVQPPTQALDSPAHGRLDSTHLPFLTVLAGLCFAIALRFAGSGSTKARDVLLSYLQKFYSYCRRSSTRTSFDDKCVHASASMCLDVLALSCATVMAGTCDLKTLRVLRSLHARNDMDTTYGSHLATHMAIGVLSLGCGTQTFNTSNLAIASLLVAFYPVLPDSVQDNKSHLQAFRHFWVLATDSRCLVVKDVATSLPVGVPLALRLVNSDEEEIRTSPCLLPPISEVHSIRTTSTEFWNVNLDFAAHPELRDAFRAQQSLHLRRKPVSDSPFAATMLALGRDSAAGPTAAEDGAAQPLEWLFNAVPTLHNLTHAERSIVLDHGVGGPDVGNGALSVVDTRLALENILQTVDRDGLLGLKALFDWADWRSRNSMPTKQDTTCATEGGESGGALKAISWQGEGWLRDSVIESLKGAIWLAGKE